MNKKTVEFEAYTSGDHECFCFAVDLKTFKRIKGEYPDKWDEDHFTKGKYNIYPSDLFMHEDDVLLHIKVEVSRQDNMETKDEKNQCP